MFACKSFFELDTHKNIERINIMISVIIPVYNAEKYLSRCIDSVLNSSYTDFELLLINDGSTDQSLDICRQYKEQDSRITVISQENQGVSAARNLGLRICRGDWIIFIDSDDYISGDFLELITRNEYQDKDMILFDFARPRQDIPAGDQIPAPVQTEDIHTLTFKGEDMHELIRRILVPEPLTEDGNTDFRSPCARAYKSSVIDRYSIRFSRSITIGEDLLFNLAYQLKAGSCIYVPQPVYHYDMHRDSSSHSFNPKLWENHLRLQRQVKHLLKKCSAFSLFENDYFSYSLENMTYVLIHGIFSPHSTRTYRENLSLCGKLQKDTIYRQAVKYNFKNGILPRKILVFFFQIRCYPAVCLICRISYHYLCRRNN